MIAPAVAYYRVSTDDQGEDGFGMQVQQGDVCLLRRVIDFFVTREFFEVDSGKNDKRPILKRALRYCKKIGAILIIAKIDRLARHAFFVARLLESPVTIIAADKYPYVQVHLSNSTY